jgi:hypothetical protein
MYIDTAVAHRYQFVCGVYMVLVGRCFREFSLQQQLHTCDRSVKVHSIVTDATSGSQITAVAYKFVYLCTPCAIFLFTGECQCASTKQRWTLGVPLHPDGSHATTNSMKSAQQHASAIGIACHLFRQKQIAGGRLTRDLAMPLVQ